MYTLKLSRFFLFSSFCCLCNHLKKTNGVVTTKWCEEKVRKNEEKHEEKVRKKRKNDFLTFEKIILV